MKKILTLLFISGFFSVIFAAEATIPTVNLSLSAPDTPNQLVTTLNIVIVLTILALAPSIIFVMTSFFTLDCSFFILASSYGNSKYAA